jgi:hypothetical protein
LYVFELMRAEKFNISGLCDCLTLGYELLFTEKKYFDSKNSPNSGRNSWKLPRQALISRKMTSDDPESLKPFKTTLKTDQPS